MKNFIYVLTTLFIISSCATQGALNLTKSNLIDFPEKNVIVTKSLGQPLARKGLRTVGPALTLKEGQIKNRGFGTCALNTVNEQSKFVVREGNDGDQCAGPFSFSLTQDGGATNWNCPGTSLVTDVCYSEDKDIFYTYRGEFEIDKQYVETETKVTTVSTNFIQEIIYNGKVSNDLKFIYREFESELIRPAYTQEVQYDANESKIIRFKDLQIEIIKADNQKITYKLISNF